MKIGAKAIVGGERFPWFYGLAWYEPEARTSVAYPIPINILLSWLRSFYYVLRFKLSIDYKQREYARGWRVGREAGYRGGVRAGVREARRLYESKLGGGEEGHEQASN